LGFLSARSPASAARGRPRGLGLEARTDAWGHVRGEQGVLLSTTRRSQLGSSVQSFVLDTAEATAQLNAATALNKALQTSAVAQGAQVSDIALQRHPDHAKKISPVQDSEAQQALRFEKPVVMVESAANLNHTSAGSQLLYAQEHLSWTTQGDSHWVAKHTASLNSGEATTLYTHAGGMTITAAHAPVSLAAHTNALEMLSDQSTTVTSSDAAILVEAQHSITLQAGQSSITLEGGNITIKCPGNFSVKGGSHPFTGGGSDAANLERLPSDKARPPLLTESLFVQYDEQFLLKDHKSGHALSNTAYRILDATGAWHYGVTNSLGRTQRYYTENKVKFVRVELLKNNPQSDNKEVVEDDEIIEQYYELTDISGNPAHGYRYDLSDTTSIIKKSGNFSSGQTKRVKGSTNLNLVAWLNK
jgi:type VI secretion system secreted protein VgrG